MAHLRHVYSKTRTDNGDRTASDAAHWIIKSPKYAAAIFVLAAPLISASPANAVPPVPFYAAKVTGINRIGESSIVIKTSDSVGTVCAWYRKNLPDQNGETATTDLSLIHI